ncbi:hypothetical protein Tco_1042279 [Tanacetum coccineum]|uniref:Uncharacterized protein n=1 Tax=Tanacetum coccineum TaxID=301880 RepID=A0ABQ5GJS2_9ASTR
MDRGPTNVLHLLAWYIFRHAEGRKSRVRLSRGHFIGRLAMHLGLVSDEGLRGLQVVTRELSLIDLHELRRLNIYKRYSETWTWVALGPERKQGVTTGAHKADKAGQAIKEVAPEIPAPVQAPSPPPSALQPCTMSQRIERVEEEVHHLRCDVTGLREVVESFTTEQSKVSPWLISCMRTEDFGRGPYANMKTKLTHDPYLGTNQIFGGNYEASNVVDTQENQGHEEHMDNATPEQSVCKIRRFEMMKYSFGDDEYITIK